MTIGQLKATTAAFFKVEQSELTKNGVDLFLMALNTVRLNAELNHDFEFTRQSVTVAVDNVLGGSLELAVLEGTATTVRVKQVVDIAGKTGERKFPVEWTTREESMVRQRGDHDGFPLCLDEPWVQEGQPRFELRNRKLWHYPERTAAGSETVYVEAYVFSPDWTGIADYRVTHVNGDSSYTDKVIGNYSYVGDLNGRALYWNPAGFPLTRSYISWLSFHYLDDVWACHYGTITEQGNILLVTEPNWLSATSAIIGNYIDQNNVTDGIISVDVISDSLTDTWLTYGHEFLLWGVIVHLNHMFKEFVYRQEGNLMPPEKLMSVALENFKSWDATYYETNRQHGR